MTVLGGVSLLARSISSLDASFEQRREPPEDKVAGSGFRNSVSTKLPGNVPDYPHRSNRAGLFAGTFHPIHFFLLAC